MILGIIIPIAFVALIAGLVGLRKKVGWGDPNYRFTWGPERPWSDDGRSAERY